MDVSKIAFGGGCHWCTEAVFQSLGGVERVEQGFVASVGTAARFSEAVIVWYRPTEISLTELVRVHLHTHESTAAHAFRSKYRSAVYTMCAGDEKAVREAWNGLQSEFNNALITEILPFKAFRPSDEMFHNYYRSNPEKPFCKKYIGPKLELLRRKFPKQLVSTPPGVQ